MFFLISSIAYHFSMGACLRARLADTQQRKRDVDAETSGWKIRKLLRRHEEVRENLLALRSVKWPLRSWPAPSYRTYRIPAENGVRAALWIAIASAFVAWAGRPAASTSLSFAVLIAARDLNSEFRRQILVRANCIPSPSGASSEENLLSAA
ncbi:hypothetical protein ACVITL_006750 [Rhizobium pisi]